MKNKLTNEEIKNPPPKCDSCLEFEKTGKHYDNCQRNDHNFFEELLKKISPTKEDDKKVQEALGAKDIEDFFSSHLTELLQGLIVDLEGEKKEHIENHDLKEIRIKKLKADGSLVEEIMTVVSGWESKVEERGFNEGLNLAQEKLRKL